MQSVLTDSSSNNSCKQQADGDYGDRLSTHLMDSVNNIRHIGQMRFCCKDGLRYFGSWGRRLRMHEPRADIFEWRNRQVQGASRHEHGDHTQDQTGKLG